VAPSLTDLARSRVAQRLNELADAELAVALWEHCGGRDAYPGLRFFLTELRQRSEIISLMGRAKNRGAAIVELSHWLLQPPTRGTNGFLLHHWMLYFERLAEQAKTREAAALASWRSVQTLVLLTEDKVYLASLWKQVSSENQGSSAFDVKRLLLEPYLARLQARSVPNGADSVERATHQAAALATLGRLIASSSEHGTDSEAPSEEIAGFAADALRGLAEAPYAAAVSAIVGPVERTLAEEEAKNVSAVDRAKTLMAEAQRKGVYAIDTQVSIRFLAAAEAIGFEIRRLGEFALLGSLYKSLEPFIHRLERLVRQGQLSWASRTAQAYCFLADAEPSIEGQIRLTEIALEICPGHPMTRLLLSFYLAGHARRRLKAIKEQRPFLLKDEIAELVAVYHRAKAMDDTDTNVMKLGGDLRAMGHLRDEAPKS
jgi:hypothetical protein